MADAENLDIAAVGRAKIQQAFDQRGFAGAVHADQTEEFAFGDLQIDPVQHRFLVVSLDDILELQCICCHVEYG